MSEAWEVDFWTNELGVSKDELQKGINKVGNSTAAVRRELGQLGTSHQQRGERAEVTGGRKGGAMDATALARALSKLWHLRTINEGPCTHKSLL